MANLIGAAYKWRIDNNVYSYITNTEGGEPFIVSGSTECNEELIRNKVQNFTKDQYETKFQEMVSVVHAYDNGKYSYVQFLDYTIYMNEAEHCDIYNKPDVVTDVDFTVSATTLPSDSEATVGIYTTDEDIECREGEKIRKYHIDFGIPKGSRFIPIRVTDEELSQNGEQIIRENDILAGDFVFSVDSNTIWYCDKDYQFINSGVQLNVRPYRYFADINAYSFGEGDSAEGVNSITEGYKTVVTGNGSHAEGSNTLSSGDYSHAEGVRSESIGHNSHAEGNGSKSIGQNSHAEGTRTIANNNQSHSEGYETKSMANGAHAEGDSTIAYGKYSHAEGANSITGYDGILPKTNDIEEPYNTGDVIGGYAHAEGAATLATGKASHSEGNKTFASGKYSHAEGGYNTTFGESSHAEGSGNIAYGAHSHVEGIGNVAKNIGQHVSGTYAEIDDTGNAIFQVGIGTDDNTRNDAFRINKDGSFVFAVPENVDTPIFTLHPSIKEQEVSAVNEDEGEEGSTQTYNMRRSAARQTSVEVTTSNFIDLINLQNNINNAINGIEFPVTQEDLDDLKEKLSDDFEEIKGYTDSIKNSLQSQIDGVVDSYFMEGEPTITNKPASDWVETATENNKDTYAHHEGDTYTDISEITFLTSSMWEQGGVYYLTSQYEGMYYEEQKIDDNTRFRTKVLMTNKPGQTVYVPNGFNILAIYYTSNDEYLGSYSDNNKNFILPQKTDNGYDIHKIAFLVYNSDSTNLSYKSSDELKLCINPTAGQSWRWCRGNESGETVGWHWHKIADSDAVKALQAAAEAQDTADGKRRVFTNQPYTPYDVGDLWVKTNVNNTSLNDTLYCQSGRTYGDFVSTDWVSSTAALEAMNTANSALTNVQNIDFLTQVMQSGATDINGGLVLTNVLALRNIDNTTVTGGMSGVINDNVLLWGGGTYEDAVSASESSDYISSGTSIPITTLIKKDGTGKIGAFFIDKDTVKVVSDTQTTIITNKTINETAPLQTTISGSTGSCLLDATSTYTIRVEEFGNAHGYFEIIRHEVTGLTVGGGYTINVSLSDINLHVGCSENLYSDEPFNNTYCVAEGRLNGFKVIVMDGASTDTVLAEKSFSSGGNYSKEVYIDPNYQIRYETGGTFNNTASSGVVSFKTKTNKIIIVLQSFVYGKTNLGDFSTEYGDIVTNLSPNVYFNCLCEHTIKGTDKYTVIAKDGIAISSNSDAQFYINNTSSNLQVRMNGLPTSDTDLNKGDLYTSNGTLKIKL